MDRFQNGEIDVLICTFGVGSTGKILILYSIISYGRLVYHISYGRLVYHIILYYIVLRDFCLISFVAFFDILFYFWNKFLYYVNTLLITMIIKKIKVMAVTSNVLSILFLFFSNFFILSLYFHHNKYQFIIINKISFCKKLMYL